MRREGMAERVAAGRLVDPSVSHRVFHRALQERFGDMMTVLLFAEPDLSRGSDERFARGKQILPAEFARSTVVFLRQGARQIDFTVSCRQILFVDEPPLHNLTP
jgi:hypothetical protein